MIEYIMNESRLQLAMPNKCISYVYAMIFSLLITTNALPIELWQRYNN